MAEPVGTPIFRRDPRADLQTQVEKITAALQEWRQTREYTQATEERLAQITVQCARMVESWQQMDQRRSWTRSAREEGRTDRRDVELGIDPDMGERIRALERTIEHEWEGLREVPDQPATPLRDHAPTGGASDAATTKLTLRALANTESRLAALEEELQSRLAQLSNDLQSVLAELRSARLQSSPGAAAAFPLESVMRIHEELRESDATPAAGAAALKAGSSRALPERAESAAALSARVESLERTVAIAAGAASQPTRGWRGQYPILVPLAASVAAILLFGLWMQRRVDTRLNDAAVQISAAERQRDETVAATQREATRQVEEARRSAVQAQTISNVFAAPDRVRYWLVGVGDRSRAYAQVLVSRSRGLVFTAARLPSPGSGQTYQLWLRTAGGPVNAGVFSPDSAGRVTLVNDVPPALPGRLSGAVVTLEPVGGASQPSENRVLIRVD